MACVHVVITDTDDGKLNLRVTCDRTDRETLSNSPAVCALHAIVDGLLDTDLPVSYSVEDRPTPLFRE